MKLSIIIATHARPESLSRLLRSLLPQLEASRDELFIAENGTPAPTHLATSDLAGAAVAPIQVHDTHLGKCLVQNQAIAKTRGEIIVCLDDDLVVAPGYVRAVESFFTSYRQFAAMKGRVLAAEDPFKKVGPLAVYLDLPIADHGGEVVEVRGVIGANMAFLKRALDQVGPFDERLGPGAAGHEEETEMSARLRRAGFKIGYAPAALVYHEVDPARADRARYIRIARERGRARMLHEYRSAPKVALDNAIAAARLSLARILRAPLARIAREERRLAIARGMRDGLKLARKPAEDS